MSLRSYLLVAVALLVAFNPLQAFAKGECAELDGVEHCTVGAARMTAQDDFIIIDNIDGAPAGVSTSFAEGLVWTSALSLENSDEGPTKVVASARSQGEITATNTVVSTEEGLSISANFTGASDGGTYNVQVYNNGVFQGGAGGINDGDAYFLIFNRDNEDFIMWLISQWTFFFRMSDGGCGWDLDLNEVRTLRLANGVELEGDEIRLQEEVKGDGHYAYTGFDGIDIVGTQSSMTLSSAVILP